MNILLQTDTDCDFYENIFFLRWAGFKLQAKLLYN